MNIVPIDEYRVCRKFLYSKNLRRVKSGDGNTTFDWYADGYTEGQWFFREQWSKDGLNMYIVTKVKWEEKAPYKVHAYMCTAIRGAWQLADGIKHADRLYQDALKYVQNFIKEKKSKEITECAEGFEV